MRLDPALREVSWNEVAGGSCGSRGEDRAILERSGGAREGCGLHAESGVQRVAFLYREIVGQELGHIQALRADRPARVPTVLTVEETRAVIGAMSGTPQLIVKLLYGGILHAVSRSCFPDGSGRRFAPEPSVEG